MLRRITSIFICTLLISSTARQTQARGKEEPIPQAPLFCGVAVQADLAGPIMKAVGSRFNQMEVGARLNFRDHYFPLCELGIGESDREGTENNNQFHTRAPYFRVGMDYNLNKKHNGNRLMAGIRYGFSSFKYDFSDPDFTDPVWTGSAQGLELKGQQGRAQWLEFAAGCETKLWSFIRLGWNIRFKARLHQHRSEFGTPYYVPGFGKNGNSTFGGTVNLIFDVGRTTKKNKTKSTSTLATEAY